MKRALHIITGLGVGGAERQLRALLTRLPLPSDVVTLTNPGAVARELRADGVRVTHLGMAGNRDLGAVPRLARLIRRGGYDLVHTHLYRACVYGRIAARLAGVRAVVATEHSLGERVMEGRPLTPGTRALYLATERLGRATVAVSGTVAGRLRQWGVPAERIHVVPNGIAPERFRYDPQARAAVRARLGVPADAVLVGGVGRLVPGKGFPDLVRAVAGLPDEVRLVLAGEGPLRGGLERLAAELGVAGRVLLPGECAVPEVLSAMDVFVSASTEETFGLAALEALAAGLPVLHVTCPAIDELPPRAAPGARRVAPGAGALRAALRTELDRAPHRFPVPEAVRHYDIGRAAGRLMDVYEGAQSR
ncbi:glycosyltransferase [Streptomyces carpaticus]|uniref:Glycosyltransferase involved in cell wall bisynthesis n=1 Tax=Streptomyces harbinensis TaxID=1176198 RepID=A0A1I6T0B2_9ACTN|nr:MULTISPECIES: glycosyltransferase [Streptomyces]QKV69794.1 glycosyltransferase [Streptomyces harbinensis]UWM50199.1 glycosyltransferase [Streptomyces carpaticus]SFS82457.1 Glycosyltransferase involved in cell wall bisynthesis [Streptomyces harbinensis]